MKKRIMTVIYFFIMLFSICFGLNHPSFASEIWISPYTFDEAEFEMIQERVGKEEILSFIGEENVAVRDVAYRYYFIRSEVLRDKALAGEDISLSITNDSHVWVVPMDKSAACYYEEDGLWKCGITMQYPSDGSGTGEFVNNMQVSQRIMQVLDRGESLILGPVYFRAPKYSTVFAYFKTDMDQYLIPYSHVSRFTKLINGELYTALEAIRTIEEYYPIPEEAEKGDPSMMGDNRAYMREAVPEHYLIPDMGALHAEVVGKHDDLVDHQVMDFIGEATAVGSILLLLLRLIFRRTTA